MNIARERVRRPELRDQTKLGKRALTLASSSRMFGEVVCQFLRSGHVAPGWAWLNAFAHGDLGCIRQVRRLCTEELAALADAQEEAWTVSDPLENSGREAAVKQEAWRSAERVLADELLELVDDDNEILRRIQACALLSLELQLLDSKGRDALSLFELVQSTRAALRSILS